MEGMSILKTTHNGFADLQIYFDLETFRNLSQLKAETETFLSQSIMNFSLHSLLYFCVSFFTFLSLFLPGC